jgi:predicted DNA-binding protein
MNSRHSVSLEKKMTFRLTEEEFQRLESHCNQVKRSKTEILRELIRSLPESKSESQAEQ